MSVTIEKRPARRAPKWGRRAVALSFAVLVVVAAGCASAPKRSSEAIAKGDTSYLVERLDYEVQKVLDDTDAPSMVVSIVDENGPIFEKAYGLAEIEGERLATIQTPYRVGSNSKLIVMLSLLRLVDEGKVDLDAPLTTYLPEFTIGPPPPYLPGADTWTLDDITLRRMLTHHSGLPNDYLGKFFTDKPMDLDALLKATAQMRAVAPVDLHWSYSNLALALAGLVVERQSGTPLDVYAKTNFFGPWKMDEATFEWTPKVKKAIARGYSAGEKKKLYKISMWPAGRMMASASDMGKMASALLRGGDGAVNPSLLQQSMTRQNGDIALDYDWQMGLTWFLNRQDAATLGASAEHGGNTLYHHSSFALLTDQKLGVYVVTNDAKASSKTSKIASLALALALETKKGRRVPEPKKPDVHEEASGADPKRLTSIAGEWSTVMGAIDIKQPSPSSTVGAFEAVGETFEIAELESGRFGLWVKLLGLIPLRPSGLDKLEIWPETYKGLDLLVVDQKGMKGIFGVRRPKNDVNAAWIARKGRYLAADDTADHYQFIKSVEVDVDERGRVVLRMSALDSPTLTEALLTVSDTEAVTVGIGRGQSKWIRVVDDDHLDFSGLRLVRDKGEGAK